MESNNNNIKTEKEGQEEKLQSKETEEEVPRKFESHRELTETEEVEDELNVEDDESDEEYQPQDRSDNTRYEAIEEEFEFEGKSIKPCFCVLPFITDEEAETHTKRNIAVSHLKEYLFKFLYST